MVRFSKFTLNIKIYDEFIEFLSKLVWRETLFLLIKLNYYSHFSLIYIYIYISRTLAKKCEQCESK